MTYKTLPSAFLGLLITSAAACDGGSSETGGSSDSASATGKADALGDDALEEGDEVLADLTEELLARLDSAGDVAEQYNYCAFDGTDERGEPSIGSLKCRSLFRFSDDDDMFRISFLNGQGLGGASEYALRNDDGSYRLYVDDTLDGSPGVGGAFEENQELEVTFDKEGLPTIVNMTLHLSPTSFLLGDLSFGTERAVLEGVIIDEANGTESELSLAYERVD